HHYVTHTPRNTYMHTTWPCTLQHHYFIVLGVDITMSHTHTHIHAHTRTHKHNWHKQHTPQHTQIYTHTHPHTHIYIRAHTHTRTHRRTHIYTRTQTHTDAIWYLMKWLYPYCSNLIVKGPSNLNLTFL